LENSHAVSSLFIVSPEKKLIVMNVNIQTVRFDPDSKLIDHVNKKIQKLDKIAEIRVKVPRHEIFVKQTSKSFEASFDTALESIIIQIKKLKEKQAA
jgi:putative sigma-54 modulation protein